MILLWVMNVYANESVWTSLFSALLLEWEPRLVRFCKFDRIIRNDTIDVGFHILDLLLDLSTSLRVGLPLEELSLALSSLMTFLVEDIVFQEVKVSRCVHLHVQRRLATIVRIFAQLRRLLNLLEMQMLLRRIRVLLLHLLSVILWLL